MKGVNKTQTVLCWLQATVAGKRKVSHTHFTVDLYLSPEQPKAKR